MDLTTYAGKRIKLGFSHHGEEVSTGWYLDEVRVAVDTRTLPLNQTMTFENSTAVEWQGWSADNGTWEVGTPTAGPNAAHDGTQCAGTILGGNYPGYHESRLISPPVTLPAITTGQAITLQFWQWFSFAAGSWGRVQVSEWDGTAWGEWVDVSNQYNGVSGAYSLALVELTAYAGKRIKLGFSHHGEEVSTGWYLDEVRVAVDTRTLPLNQTMTFENSTAVEWQGWSADNGTWEVGTPTSGPNAAHEGTKCAGTILGGNYPGYHESRLISPPVTLPPSLLVRLSRYSSGSGLVLRLAVGDAYRFRNGMGRLGVSGSMSVISIMASVAPIPSRWWI